MKVNLKKLTALFAQSAGNDKLPAEIRKFAAQLTILTRHLSHVDGKVQTEVTARKTLDNHIAELAELVMLSQKKPEGEEVTASAEGPVDLSDLSIEEGIDAEEAAEQSEEDEAKAMAEQVQRETEAEVKAAAASVPASVTPLHKPNGDTKMSAEEAS